MTKSQFLAANLKTLLNTTGLSFAELNQMDMADLELLLTNQDPLNDPEAVEYDSNVYLNIDLVIPDGRHLRISGIRLDSDFVQFMDKEHTKPNVAANSLLQTINNKGVQYANDNAQFAVTVTKQGESSVELTDELF